MTELVENIWQLVSHHVIPSNHNTAWIRRVNKKMNLTYSYSTIYVNSVLIAQQLSKSGVVKGDLIGIIAPNGPEWGCAALGVWQLGAIVTPIHNCNSEDEISHQIDIVQPKFILSFKSNLQRSNIVQIELVDDHKNASFEISTRSVDIALDDEAVRIYTSGSTGNAKMVRLSHRNICSNVQAAVAFSPPLGDSDRFLSLLPLSHAMELTGGMLFPLRVGAAIVLPRVLAANEILAALKDEKITMLIAVPRLYRNILIGIEKKFKESGLALNLYIKLLKVLPISLRKVLNFPIRNQLGSNIKAWISGGSRLDPDITRAYHDLGLPLRQGYGLTETSPVAAVQQEFDPVVESVGKPLENMEIKIHEADSSGIGEVWIKGPNVMLGYTDEALSQEDLEQGWFKSGDLGRLDDRGNLILTGRSKRLIVTEAGKNVYPEDIEIKLERYDELKEAAITEVEMKPAAILAINLQDDSPLSQIHIEEIKLTGAISTAKKVLANYNANASGHNQIYQFAVVNELPKTPLGKISIKQLPEIFQQFKVQ